MKCLEMKIKNIKVMNAIYLNAGSLKQIMQSNVLMHNQNFVHFISFPIPDLILSLHIFKIFFENKLDVIKHMFPKTVMSSNV